MSLYAGLQKRAAEGRPLRVGLIGAGKFGAMYLAQVPKTPGIHLAAIADLSPANAAVNLQRVGWVPERFAAFGCKLWIAFQQACGILAGRVNERRPTKS